MTESEGSSFTGRSRDRKTRTSVKVADKVSKALITFGGIGTIIAVSTVCIYLVSVAVPLFFKAKAEGSAPVENPGFTKSQMVHVIMDEYRELGATFYEDGSVQVFRVETGEAVGERQNVVGDRELTATSFLTDRDDVAFGYADGYGQLGTMGIAIEFIGEDSVPDAVYDLPIGDTMLLDDKLYVHTQPGQFRSHQFRTELKPAVKLGDEPVSRIAHTIGNTGPVLIALTGETFSIYAVREIRNFLTGAVTPSVQRGDIPYTPRTDQPNPPDYVLLSKLGDMAYMAWDDGYLRRYDTRNLNNASLMQEIDLTDGATGLSALDFLIGRTTIISGDTEGYVKAWFNAPDDRSPDGVSLVNAHNLGKGPDTVTALTGASRSRLLAAGYANGMVRLYHVTAHNLLKEVDAGWPVKSVVIGAREDTLLAAGDEEMVSWLFDQRYPAISFSSLFTKVWYEGYAEPIHMWQSSSATDDFEPKYGLIPLIFGTLKATFYSLLFGLPIAILAAIFTSEFMDPKVKTRVKPLIEMMASLPSVVLGFMAALVIAPAVENIVPSVLSAFFTLPMVFLIGAYLWQLLPRGVALRFEHHRFLLIFLTIPIGVLWAGQLGPFVEQVLFAGDMKRWLDGQIGSGAGGWFILLMPLTAVGTGVILNRLLEDRIRAWSRHWSRGRAAITDGLKFAGGVVLWLVINWVLSHALGAVWDPRGTEIHNFLGTYVQRNAMVVGFIMGFAIIPIIYTLAEDALSSVPEHLRSASLGAGATPWQTAVRIIMPTAMSGLFSAAMIGLGRAVGETMIVLMAAGNTPVMEMNIFNGFRTLSANIAVELPEAPVGGTHYRVLFLAALALFVMTFIINTFAESVRQRFRKRAFEL